MPIVATQFVKVEGSCRNERVKNHKLYTRSVRVSFQSVYLKTKLIFGGSWLLPKTTLVLIRNLHEREKFNQAQQAPHLDARDGRADGRL